MFLYNKSISLLSFLKQKLPTWWQKHWRWLRKQVFCTCVTSTFTTLIYTDHLQWLEGVCQCWGWGAVGGVSDRRAVSVKTGRYVHHLKENSCYWRGRRCHRRSINIRVFGWVRIEGSGGGGWNGRWVWGLCSGEYLCLFGTRAWPGSPCAHSPGHTGPASPPLPHTALQTHVYSLQHNTQTDRHQHTQCLKRQTYRDNNTRRTMGD